MPGLAPVIITDFAAARIASGSDKDRDSAVELFLEQRRLKRWS
jgi:hypothetical protein